MFWPQVKNGKMAARSLIMFDVSEKETKMFDKASIKPFCQLKLEIQVQSVLIVIVPISPLTLVQL